MPTKQFLNELKVPPELEKVYNRVVLAGMKVMFSSETHSAMVQQLQAGGPLEQRIGEGIVQLMGILYQQSNGTIPGEVIIPAGINLLLQAFDFVERTGTEQVNDHIIANAIQVFLEGIFQQTGHSLDEVVSELERMAGQPAMQGA